MSSLLQLLWVVVFILLLILIGGTVAWFGSEGETRNDIQLQNDASKEKNDPKKKSLSGEK